ncbi:uncharacterized protein EDB93DRAFT_1257143 [Suillus bovinus]|uniref:uncharacterized protein n=1 Tax=Suillus bovinus TaxID=48563 RepID=UPI001B8731D2|nr:uncharacterized protein EDB93DRAFT_1257143 [Suillus bovinus]KAG2127191.1 hypothetical protein EDB93DRAFT_1257143 [Suillus bovinus]
MALLDPDTANWRDTKSANDPESISALHGFPLRRTATTINLGRIWAEDFGLAACLWREHKSEHLDAWAPTIFLLILLISALASYPYPDLTLVILVILAFPFALYLLLQQSQYIWPDPFADEAYPCSVPPPD